LQPCARQIASRRRAPWCRMVPAVKTALRRTDLFVNIVEPPRSDRHGQARGTQARQAAATGAPPSLPPRKRCDGKDSTYLRKRQVPFRPASASCAHTVRQQRVPTDNLTHFRSGLRPRSVTPIRVFYHIVYCGRLSKAPVLPAVCPARRRLQERHPISLAKSFFRTRQV
jgi:hypothetical protein